jgi:uncharacterized membrane protein YgdD (TMEM256/DUF423 family)
MNPFVPLGAALAFLGIALGAFGAHAIRDAIPPDRLAVYQTGVQYHQLHAVALILVGLLHDRVPQRGARRIVSVSGWLFVVGIVVFAGSLYALALSSVRALGAITPLGGLCFLAGWALLVFAAARQHNATSESER